MKKFALVLSGGGFKGAFQIGALNYLKENWSNINPDNPLMKFDIIAGVSVGSLNGVLLASDQFEELQRLWEDVAENGVEEVYTSDFINTRSTSEKLEWEIDVEELVRKFVPSLDIRISFFQGLKLLISRNKREKFLSEILFGAQEDFQKNFQDFKSLAENTPLKEKIRSLIKINNIRDCLFKCGYVSLDTGEYYSLQPQEFASDEDFQNGILASSAMPILWEPVEKINTMTPAGQTRNLVDGAVRNVSPLSDVIDEINRDTSGAEYIIFIINCNSTKMEEENHELSNIAQIALRSFSDIALAEIFNNDLEEFLRINDILEQIKSVKPDLDIYNYDYKSRRRTDEVLKSFKSVIIQPDPATLGDTLVATKEVIYRRMEIGREKAMLAIEEWVKSRGQFKYIIT